MKIKIFSARKSSNGRNSFHSLKSGTVVRNSRRGFGIRCLSNSSGCPLPYGFQDFTLCTKHTHLIIVIDGRNFFTHKEFIITVFFSETHTVENGEKV